MTDKNKIIVNIMSKDYTLKSDDSIEHMNNVSEFVKKKISDIKSNNRRLNSITLAVLSALNITDEYFKILEYNKELEKRVENPEYELRVIKDKLTHITKEFDEKNRAYNKIINEFNSLFENSAVYENGLNELRDSVNDLKRDIKYKEEEIKVSDKKIKELKYKIDKKEEIINESKQELEEFISEFDERHSN
jgi:cell division protein ZapA